MPGLPLPASTHIALVHKFVRIFPVVEVCGLLEKYRRVTRGLPGHLIVDSSHRLVNGELVDRVLPPRVCFELFCRSFRETRQRFSHGERETTICRSNVSYIAYDVTKRKGGAVRTFRFATSPKFLRR